MAKATSKKSKALTKQRAKATKTVTKAARRPRSIVSTKAKSKIAMIIPLAGTAINAGKAGKVANVIDAPKASIAAPSKQDQILKLLRTPSGTTIAAIMKETEWKPHSVRGFLAGVVRKKLKLDLQSTIKDGVRHYRIKPSAGR